MQCAQQVQARDAAPCEHPQAERCNRPLAMIRNPPWPPQPQECNNTPRRGTARWKNALTTQ
eukprot:6028715-Alexandrium_andersonii.AAC.1